jgi:hypothetical protein
LCIFPSNFFPLFHHWQQQSLYHFHFKKSGFPANLRWLGLGAFVGVNLVQSSFTKFCPLEKILDSAGVKGKAC